MRRRLIAVALLAACLPAYAAFENDGAWKAGSWAAMSWADGAWAEDGGAETSPFTNVIGEANSAAADAAFEADGFDLGAVTERCSDEADDEVVGQDPAPGTEQEAGTLGNILVSNGVECPNNGRPGVRMRGLTMPGL